MTLAQETRKGIKPTTLETTELMLTFSKSAALGALLGLAALAAAPASASPTTLVFSGLGTGIIHGNGFNNAQFSFSFVTDTNFIQNTGGGVYSTSPYAAPVAVSLAGSGTGTSTNPAYFSFLPASNIFGLTDSVTGEKVFFAQSTTPPGSGPVAITLLNQAPYQLAAFQTTLGPIQFTEIHNATFSGALSNDAAPVPEASTAISLFLLLTLGAGTLVVAARRKKNRRVGAGFPGQSSNLPRPLLQRGERAKSGPLLTSGSLSEGEGGGEVPLSTKRRLCR